jgi:hypothetical protein
MGVEHDLAAAVDRAFAGASSSSMSDCSTWCPPSSTSTLATSLTSPPAPKLAHTSSIVTPDMRSAISTASRTATSLASMSVT